MGLFEGILYIWCKGGREEVNGLCAPSIVFDLGRRGEDFMVPAV